MAKFPVAGWLLLGSAVVALPGTVSGVPLDLSGTPGPNTVEVVGEDRVRLNAGAEQTGIDAIVGGAGEETVVFTPLGSLDGSVDGGAGSDTLISSDAPGFFQITGADGGFAPGVGGGFSNVENLTAGAGNDSFDVLGGSLSGTVDGGAGVDTLTLDDTNNEIVLTGTNAGTVAGQVGNFVNVEQIVGSAGTDTLTSTDADTDFVLTGPASGTVTGLDGSFVSIDSLNGGAGSDSFSLAGNGIAGTIDGRAGIDTVISGDAAELFQITGADSGLAPGVVGVFSNIENLTAGAADGDVFELLGGSVSGTVDGGAGIDTLTLDDTNNEIVLTSTNAGTVTGRVGSFVRIEQIVGSAGTDSLTATDADTDFVLTGAASGTVTGLDGSFVGIDSLNGGAGADSFSLAGNVLAGAIDGRAGTDTLISGDSANFFQITGADSGLAPGVVGGFSNIENLTAGAADGDSFDLFGGSVSGVVDGGEGLDILTLDDTNNRIQLTGQNAGTVAGRVGSFVRIEQIVGSAGLDTLTAADVDTVFTVAGLGFGTVSSLDTGFVSIETLGTGAGEDMFLFESGGRLGFIEGFSVGDALDVSALITAGFPIAPGDDLFDLELLEMRLDAVLGEELWFRPTLADPFERLTGFVSLPGMLVSDLADPYRIILAPEPAQGLLVGIAFLLLARKALVRRILRPPA